MARRLWSSGSRLTVGVVLGLALPVYAAEPVGCQVPTESRPPLKITLADRRDAMLAVHANAYFAAGLIHVPPAELGLPALSKAVQTIYLDAQPNRDDRLAPSRLRRAVAKLARYSLVDHSGELTKSWRSLLGCKPDLIKLVEQQLRSPDPESAVYNSLAMFSVSNCQITSGDFDDPTKDEDGVKLKLSLVVGMGLSDLKDHLDPQNWDQCNPTYFSKAYLTSETQLPDPVCPAQVPDPAAATGQPIGTGYSGTLFEDFQCPPCKSEFKNLLNMSVFANDAACASPNPCGVEPVPWQACYTLRDSAGCYEKLGAPMTNDKGDLSICSAGSAFSVTSSKVVKFDWDTLNDMFYVYALISQQEMNEMLAEVVCCGS